LPYISSDENKRRSGEEDESLAMQLCRRENEIDNFLSILLATTLFFPPSSDKSSWPIINDDRECRERIEWLVGVYRRRQSKRSLYILLQSPIYIYVRSVGVETL
jgi:hypothetical protein